ncbi:hypothetical protein ACFQPA_03115 [Halomarina halobia]|uniref:Uncharacterized protein n=1 Tax=Halomarina halobia TaxID=3033386 RepID=A0ABD6A504_9EURY|nr:hypothetical protein [Halomarina sp. PSR21]
MTDPADPGEPLADADPDEFEDLPTSDIEVECHVHFGMTGSFPLRLAEVFFANDGLHVAEYGYLTPLFGLGMRKHRREAGAMERIYEVHGIDEVLLQADAVHWYGYGALDRVVLHDGGQLGRPRLAVHPATGASHAYRLHEVDDFDALCEAVATCGDRHGVAVERGRGLGFSPRESVERFFLD